MCYSCPSNGSTWNLWRDAKLSCCFRSRGERLWKANPALTTQYCCMRLRGNNHRLHLPLQCCPQLGLQVLGIGKATNQQNLVASHSLHPWELWQLQQSELNDFGNSSIKEADQLLGGHRNLAIGLWTCLLHKITAQHTQCFCFPGQSLSGMLITKLHWIHDGYLSGKLCVMNYTHMSSYICLLHPHFKDEVHICVMPYDGGAPQNYMRQSCIYSKLSLIHYNYIYTIFTTTIFTIFTTTNIFTTILYYYIYYYIYFTIFMENQGPKAPSHRLRCSQARNPIFDHNR